MLVLVTMFINVSNNLPKTSYMKMMDVWLLGNLMYPFIVVLMHTYMDTLRNNDDDKRLDDGTESRRIKKLLFWKRASILYSPVLVLVFMIFYWLAGLKHAGIL